ncbi:MAG: hypothetical protein QM736_28230 [Vicinamibacterales bacterium]
MRRLGLAVALFVAAGTLSASAQRSAAPDVMDTVAHIGEYVQSYVSRAQSIICDEIVRVQELGYDLLGTSSPARVVVSELRVSWDAAPDGAMLAPQVLRNLLTVNGRPPREKDLDRCFDPQASTPEMLGELFLPDNRSKFRFTARPSGKVSGRPALVIDVVDLQKGPVEMKATDDCVEFGKPGTMKWRVWVDPATYAVLRIDQSLNTLFDVTIPPNRKHRLPERDLLLERADTSVVYRQVTFTDPDETILLPATREAVQVIRNSPSPRMRISSMYKNYRRFMTGIRIVQQ